MGNVNSTKGNNPPSSPTPTQRLERRGSGFNLGPERLNFEEIAQGSGLSDTEEGLVQELALRLTGLGNYKTSQAKPHNPLYDPPETTAEKPRVVQNSRPYNPLYDPPEQKPQEDSEEPEEPEEPDFPSEMSDHQREILGLSPRKQTEISPQQNVPIASPVTSPRIQISQVKTSKTRGYDETPEGILYVYDPKKKMVYCELNSLFEFQLIHLEPHEQAQIVKIFRKALWSGLGKKAVVSKDGTCLKLPAKQKHGMGLLTVRLMIVLMRVLRELGLSYAGACHYLSSLDRLIFVREHLQGIGCLEVFPSDKDLNFKLRGHPSVKEYMVAASRDRDLYPIVSNLARRLYQSGIFPKEALLFFETVVDQNKK